MRREPWCRRPLRVSCEIPEKLILGELVKAFKLFSLALLAASTTAFTQNFTVEQVMSSPFPTQLTSATHAEVVSWAFNNKGSDNVWIATAPDFVGRQVTHYTGDDGQHLASLKLTPDRRTVGHARGTE